MPTTHSHTSMPVAPVRAFHNPRAMQPVLDLLVARQDADLRAILIHGLVEHVMRGSHCATAGDERRDAIADFATILFSPVSGDWADDWRTWAIGVLTRAWIAPRDDPPEPAWRLFTASERRATWAIIRDVIHRVRELPRTDNRDQALCDVSNHIATTVEAMAATIRNAGVRADVTQSDVMSIETFVGAREARVTILPVLLECYAALHQSEVVFWDDATEACASSLADAADSLLRMGLLSPGDLGPLAVVPSVDTWR